MQISTIENTAQQTNKMHAVCCMPQDSAPSQIGIGYADRPDQRTNTLPHEQKQPCNVASPHSIPSLNPKPTTHTLPTNTILQQCS
jgi:hypothetical protein